MGTDEIVAPNEEIELTGEDTLGGEVAMGHRHRDKEAVTKDTQPWSLPIREGDLHGGLREIQLLGHLREVGRDVAAEIDPDKARVIGGQHGDVIERNLSWLRVFLEQPGHDPLPIRRARPSPPILRRRRRL